MLECFKCGLFWRGIKHDLSKYRPREFFAYARYFDGDRRTNDPAFDRAWLFHQCSNDHHWQWWCVPHDEGDGFEVHEMSASARKEMLCDWVGAGRAYNGATDSLEWYTANRDRLQLHISTRCAVEKAIGF